MDKLTLEKNIGRRISKDVYLLALEMTTDDIRVHNVETGKLTNLDYVVTKLVESIPVAERIYPVLYKEKDSLENCQFH